jgi:hypothetical protein
MVTKIREWTKELIENVSFRTVSMESQAKRLS